MRLFQGVRMNVIVPRDNPAGRLFDVLSEAVEQPNNWNARKAWSSVFNISEANTGEILRELAEVINQIENAVRDVNGLPNEETKELFLEPLSELEGVFSIIRLDETWQGFKKRIPNNTMDKLKYTAVKLSEFSREIVLESEELDDLRTSVERVIEQTINSNIDDDLRKVLVRDLEYIRRSIISYRLRGTEGLVEVADLTLGTIARESQTSTAEESKTLSEVWGVLTKLYTAACMAEKVASLPGVSEILGLPSGS